MEIIGASNFFSFRTYISCLTPIENGCLLLSSSGFSSCYITEPNLCFQPYPLPTPSPMYAHTRACANTHTNTRTHKHTHTPVCAHTHTNTHTNTRTCARARAHTNTRTHLCSSTGKGRWQIYVIMCHRPTFFHHLGELNICFVFVD